MKHCYWRHQTKQGNHMGKIKSTSLISHTVGMSCGCVGRVSGWVDAVSGWVGGVLGWVGGVSG